MGSLKRSKDEDCGTRDEESEELVIQHLAQSLQPLPRKALTKVVKMGLRQNLTMMTKLFLAKFKQRVVICL